MTRLNFESTDGKTDVANEYEPPLYTLTIETTDKRIAVAMLSEAKETIKAYDHEPDREGY